MDKLTQGTWIVNTVKHLTEIKQNTSELSYFEATEQAGKAGTFLSKLVAKNQEVIDIKKAKVFARESSISPAELNVYLGYLKSQEKVDFNVDKLGNPREIEIYCFSNREALETVSSIYEDLESSEEEQANLIGLNETFNLPCYPEELVESLTINGVKESIANEIITIQENFGLVKSSIDGKQKVLFNEYSFNGDPQKVVKALSGLEDNEKQLVLEVIDLVSSSQGFLSENIPHHIPKNTLHMMEGVGLLDGVDVQSNFGNAVFYTTPHIKGKGVGTFLLSDDVFHQAKILLSCLRFGQTKSTYGRGKISSGDKMMNIINKLLRGEWVGPATAIGEDYHILEIAGVIQTRVGASYGYEMQLRQLEVGELAKQMLIYNSIVAEDFNIAELLKYQPTGFTAPESRKNMILAKNVAPVETMRNKLLQNLRTGG